MSNQNYRLRLALWAEQVYGKPWNGSAAILAVNELAASWIENESERERYLTMLFGWLTPQPEKQD